LLAVVVVVAVMAALSLDPHFNQTAHQVAVAAVILAQEAMELLQLVEHRVELLELVALSAKVALVELVVQEQVLHTQQEELVALVVLAVAVVVAVQI
jgi:hypothetical protein